MRTLPFALCSSRVIQLSPFLPTRCDPDLAPQPGARTDATRRYEAARQGLRVGLTEPRHPARPHLLSGRKPAAGQAITPRPRSASPAPASVDCPARCGASGPATHHGGRRESAASGRGRGQAEPRSTRGCRRLDRRGRREWAGCLEASGC